MAISKISTSLPHSCTSCSACTDLNVNITIEIKDETATTPHQGINPPIRSRLSDLGKPRGSQDVRGGSYTSQLDQNQTPRSFGQGVTDNQNMNSNMTSKSFEQPWEPAYGGSTSYTFAGTHGTYQNHYGGRNLTMSRPSPIPSPQLSYGYASPANSGLPIRTASTHNTTIYNPYTPPASTASSSPSASTQNLQLFPCNTCAKSYTHASDLERHARKHDSKRFPCRFSNCKHAGEGAFERHDHLKTHLRNAHGRRE